MPLLRPLGTRRVPRVPFSKRRKGSGPFVVISAGRDARFQSKNCVFANTARESHDAGSRELPCLRFAPAFHVQCRCYGLPPDCARRDIYPLSCLVHGTQVPLWAEKTSRVPSPASWRVHGWYIRPPHDPHCPRSNLTAKGPICKEVSMTS